MPTCPHCNHTFVENVPAPSSDYPSFSLLRDSVLSHVRATGVVVTSEDDPRTRRIGFTTSVTDGPNVRRWEITLSKLRESMVVSPYRSYLMQAEGRAALASIWSEGREPSEDFVATPS